MRGSAPSSGDMVKVASGASSLTESSNSNTPSEAASSIIVSRPLTESNMRTRMALSSPNNASLREPRADKTSSALVPASRNARSARAWASSALLRESKRIRGLDPRLGEHAIDLRFGLYTELVDILIERADQIGNSSGHRLVRV